MALYSRSHSRKHPYNRAILNQRILYSLGVFVLVEAPFAPCTCAESGRASQRRVGWSIGRQTGFEKAFAIGIGSLLYLDGRSDCIVFALYVGQDGIKQTEPHLRLALNPAKPKLFS
jgi:hypothetical protein